MLLLIECILVSGAILRQHLRPFLVLRVLSEESDVRLDLIAPLKCLASFLVLKLFGKLVKPFVLAESGGPLRCSHWPSTLWPSLL